MLGKSNADELMKLFNEYESQESQEAQLGKDFDLYDLILQAFEYEKRDESPGRHDEFFINTKGKFKNEFVKKLVDELYHQRELYSQNSSEFKGKSTG